MIDYSHVICFDCQNVYNKNIGMEVNSGKTSNTFAILVIIGILMVILGITFRKKRSPTVIVCLLIFGSFNTVISGIVTLTFGFFLR